MQVSGLEQQLRELCHDEAGERESDLDRVLADVRRAARATWTPVLLQWFTDHTSEGHSRRIVALLGEALATGTPLRLTRDELFVLIAATYLHDLGMQDGVVEDRVIDEHSAEQWDFVRERHPARSRALIVDQTLASGRSEIRTGLADDSQYVELVAIVAEAHGSAFFERDVEELDALQARPNNERVRAAGLAALLLMGDELDLHQVRVESLWPVLKRLGPSPTSLLHFHLHHYVVGVSFAPGVTTKHRRIELALRLPQASAGEREHLREWLVRRLVRQSRRTNAVLLKAFDGDFLWDDVLAIDEGVTDSRVVRALPEAAVRVLREDVLRARIVARTDLLEDLDQAIAQRAARHAIVAVRERAASDAGALLDWFEANVALAGAALVQLDCSLRIGHGPADLGERIADQLMALGEPSAADDPPPRGSDELAGWLRERIAAGDLVLALRAPERAERSTAAWLDRLLDDVVAGGSGLVLLLSRSVLDSERISSSHRLNPFSERQVASYLRKRLGYGEEEARLRARSVAGLSGGRPAQILTELQEELRQHVLLLGEDDMLEAA